MKLDYSIKNEIVNLAFYFAVLIFLIPLSVKTKDYFSFVGTGIGIGLFLSQINIVVRILINIWKE